MQYRLADHSLVFSTRDRGAKMRADLLATIDTAPTQCVVDFEGVLSASYSFIDEFVGVLIEDMGGAAPEFVNVPSAVCRTIERSLKRRGVDADCALSGSLETA